MPLSPYTRGTMAMLQAVVMCAASERTAVSGMRNFTSVASVMLPHCRTAQRVAPSADCAPGRVHPDPCVSWRNPLQHATAG